VLVYYVYVLRNDEGRFYVGQTDDLTRRLAERNGGTAFSTRNRGLWHLVSSRRGCTAPPESPARPIQSPQSQRPRVMAVEMIYAC